MIKVNLKYFFELTTLRKLTLLHHMQFLNNLSVERNST